MSGAAFGPRFHFERKSEIKMSGQGDKNSGQWSVASYQKSAGKDRKRDSKTGRVSRRRVSQGKSEAERRRVEPEWELARSQSARIQNDKQRGEWAELCFTARAAGIGLCVCKPYGDSAQYDVGIEQEGRIRSGAGEERGTRLLRVQIKSTTYSRDGSFTCNLVGRGHRGYAEGVVDVFAVYVVPLDVWYIVPFAATAGTVSLQFKPGRKSEKYRRYMEAWHLLR